MLSRLQPFLFALLVFVADRVTKIYIQQHVGPFDTIPVIPGFFNIVHTQNRGAAFGMFSESTGAVHTILLVGVSLVVLGFVITTLWAPRRTGFTPSLLLRIGLSLVLGGAIGNVYDRLMQGSVTDFLQFFFGAYEFPSFNVADSAISVGAGLLLLDMWLSHRQNASAQPVSPK